MVAGPDRDAFVVAVADGGCRIASARKDGDGDNDSETECHFRQIHDHLSDLGTQAFGARADLIGAIRRSSDDLSDERGEF